MWILEREEETCGRSKLKEMLCREDAERSDVPLTSRQTQSPKVDVYQR